MKTRVSLTAAISCSLATLVVGVATGVLAARGSRPVARPSRSPRATVTAGAQRVEETPGARVPARAESEKRPSGEPAPAETPGREAKDALARRMLLVFTDVESQGYDGDPADILSLVGRLDELDASMARYFLDRHLEDPSSARGRIALMLALACGGEDVSAFLVERLNDPAVPASERVAILPMFEAGSLVPPARVPLTPALAETAQRLIVSPDAQERMVGAGLLGGSPGPTALARLAQAAEADPEESVRLAAVRAIGRCGNAAAADALRALLARRPESRRFASAVEAALRQIAARE